MADLVKPQASAGCDIRLRYGVLITAEHIRFIEGHITKVQINNDQQLFINGQWIQLQPHEQVLLQKFSRGLRQEVPQIVAIAMEGAEIGLNALDQLIAGIAQGNQNGWLEQEFAAMRARFKQKFNHIDDKFYIAPQSLDKLSSFFQQELGQEIKTVVTRSLGAVMTALADAINSNRGEFEQNVVDVSEQLTMLEQQIDQQLQAKSHVLQQKAQQFCYRLTELDRTERELLAMLPRLRKYELVKLL